MFKIQTLIVAASLLFITPAYAEVPVYKLVNEKSTLKFYAINNGAPVEGQFKKFTADIHFSADKLDESKIKIEVDIASVFADYDEVMKSLVSKDWLAADAFPKAVFSCEKLSRMPNSDNYYADGKLQLRDKTMPVVLNFQMEFSDAKTAIAKGYLTLHRKDFGIGQGEWAKDDVVKDEVRVEFRVVAEKQ